MVQNIPNNPPTKQYMQPDQFCFWLQGLFELCPDLTNLTEAQVKMIRDHLNYVFYGKGTAVTFTSQVPYTTTSPFTTVTYPGIDQITTVTYPGIDQITTGTISSGITSVGSPILTTVC